MNDLVSDLADIRLRHPDGPSPANRLYKEQQRALKDLRRHSAFKPRHDHHGPYTLTLAIHDNRIIFDIINAKAQALPTLVLSLSPYKRLLKDYMMMIDSYETMRHQHISLEKLEAVDMARRAIHNEAANKLVERLADRLTLSHGTARDLFTLLCTLYIGTRKSVGI